MLNDAQRFWDAIVGKVRRTAQDESKNALRMERYEVTTAANGTKMGVTLPMGTKEIFLPYSNEVASATVGTPVLVGWWGSMSNAKVYYFADGYKGGDLLANHPIGSFYESELPTSPAALFGGTWEQIKDVFTLAAGDTYSAGATGGEAEHTLTTDEMSPHTHGSKTLTGSWTIGVARIGGTTTSSGIISDRQASRSAYFSTTSSSSTTNTVGFNITATHEHDSVGGGQAHNNMPPYLVVYKWKRVA